MDLDEAIKELRDALTVTAAVQERQAALIKDHGEWLASHDRAMNEIREAGRATDRRIEALVGAIGELIRKI